MVLLEFTYDKRCWDLRPWNTGRVWCRFGSYGLTRIYSYGHRRSYLLIRMDHDILRALKIFGHDSLEDAVKESAKGFSEWN